VKPGAIIVLDAGINTVAEVVGDVDFAGVEVASFLTPVPVVLALSLTSDVVRHALLGPW